MAVVFALEHHSNGTRDGWILPLSDTQGPATLGLPVAIGLPSVLHVIYTVLLAWRSMRAPQPTRRESPGAGTVIVESALPYGCLSLALLILWATKSIAVNDFIPMLIQIQVSSNPRIFFLDSHILVGHYCRPHHCTHLHCCRPSSRSASVVQICPKCSPVSTKARLRCVDHTSGHGFDDNSNSTKQ